MGGGHAARTRLKEEVYHRLLEVTLIVDVVHFVGPRLVEVSVVIQSGDAQALLLLPTCSFYQLQSRKWSTSCLTYLLNILKSIIFYLTKSIQHGVIFTKLLIMRLVRPVSEEETLSDLSSKFQDLRDSVCRPLSPNQIHLIGFFFV